MLRSGLTELLHSQTWEGTDKRNAARSTPLSELSLCAGYAYGSLKKKSHNRKKIVGLIKVQYFVLISYNTMRTYH